MVLVWSFLFWFGFLSICSAKIIVFKILSKHELSAMFSSKVSPLLFMVVFSLLYTGSMLLSVIL